MRKEASDSWTCQAKCYVTVKSDQQWWSGAGDEGDGKATALDVVVQKLLLTRGHLGEFAETSLEIQTEGAPRAKTLEQEGKDRSASREVSWAISIRSLKKQNQQGNWGLCRPVRPSKWKPAGGSAQSSAPDGRKPCNPWSVYTFLVAHQLRTRALGRRMR